MGRTQGGYGARRMAVTRPATLSRMRSNRFPQPMLLRSRCYLHMQALRCVTRRYACVCCLVETTARNQTAAMKHCRPFNATHAPGRQVKAAFVCHR